MFVQEVESRRLHPQGAHSGVQPTVSTSVSDLIVEIAELRDRGILTNEEFEAKKQDLLKRI